MWLAVSFSGILQRVCLGGPPFLGSSNDVICPVAEKSGDSVTRGQGVLFYPFLQLQFGTESLAIPGGGIRF